MTKNQLRNDFDKLNHLGFNNELPKIPVLLDKGFNLQAEEIKGMTLRNNLNEKIKIVIYDGAIKKNALENPDIELPKFSTYRYCLLHEMTHLFLMNQYKDELNNFYAKVRHWNPLISQVSAIRKEFKRINKITNHSIEFKLKFNEVFERKEVCEYIYCGLTNP